MTLELIIFIAAILFGIFIYWRESKKNSLYRFVNKVFNSKELQMKADNKKGFVYQQDFVLRLVYIGILFLAALVIFQFIIPIQVATVSLFASVIAGTLIGTYIANVIFKSSEILEEQSDNLEDIVQETLDKGKNYINDLKEDKAAPVEVTKIEKKPESEEKSARERLKDKGLL